jgi:hypothetical protein
MFIAYLYLFIFMLKVTILIKILMVALQFRSYTRLFEEVNRNDVLTIFLSLKTFELFKLIGQPNAQFDARTVAILIEKYDQNKGIYG